MSEQFLAMSALLVPMAIFTLVATMTPGPNNILLALSGVHFGMRRSLPHICGIRLGLLLLHLAVIFGLGELFQRIVSLQFYLKWLSTLYLVYLAWKIWHSQGAQQQKQPIKPMSFLQAAGFQWINPKSWFSLLTLTSAFTLPEQQYLGSALLGLAVFFVVGVPSSFVWVWAGQRLAELAKQPQQLKLINRSLALLLSATIFFIWQ